jgi:hypothetical protein
MNRGFIYGTLLAFALASGGIASAKTPSSSPDRFMKGSYVCELTGGFIVQTGSTALAQFAVDGDGNVTASSGELNVTVGSNTTVSTPSNGFFFDNEYSYEQCEYSPSGGSYSLSANGAGTLSVNWTAGTSNPDSPLDCTGNITTNFDVLVNSASSFLLNSTDLLGDCTTDTFDYADCGSTLVGSCQQQAGKL